MLVTDRQDVAEKVRLLRSHGMTSLTWDRHQGHAYSYDVVELGYNYRIDELRSALGLTQLRKLEAGNARREALTRDYWQDLCTPENGWGPAWSCRFAGWLMNCPMPGLHTISSPCSFRWDATARPLSTDYAWLGCRPVSTHPPVQTFQIIAAVIRAYPCR